MANIKIDCKNLMCPRPIIDLSKAIKTINSGEILELEVTDPAFESDLQAWIKQTRHELISFTAGVPMVAVIRKR